MKLYTRTYLNFIVGCFLASSLVYGQEADLKGNIIVKPGIHAEDDIQYMHSLLPDLLKKLNLQDKKEVVINIGPRYNPGNKIKYVFEEKVIIRMSGNNISEIRFVYDQSNEASLYREKRELSNTNPSDRNLSGLSLKYSSSDGEKMDYPYPTIQSEAQKVKVLRAYRDSLSDFVRWLDFYGGKGNKEKKSIQKALSVGSM